MREVVVNLTLQYLQVTDDFVDTLHIAPGPKWQWVQRWLERLLRYLGAKQLRCEVSTRNMWTRLDTHNVMDIIRKHRHVCEMLWHGELDRVLVGRDEMFELKEKAFHAAPSFVFMTELDLCHGNQFKVMDITIQFVPWINGVVCVPKVRS